VLRARSLVASLAAVAALAFGAAGCGGDHDTTDTTGATGAAGASGVEGGAAVSNDVAVSETEFAMTPSNVQPDDGEGGPPTSQVKAGKVTFTITNDGSETHSFVFNNAGKEIPIDGDLAPGDSAQLTVDVTGGFYEYYCPIDGHEIKGMQGQLEVVD
jgi:uncharacterized cupredoxin-like copper-binding protein